MVYIIIAHMFPDSDMVLNNCAYRTHSQAEKALDEFSEDNMDFDRHTDSYEIAPLSIMKE